VPSLSLIFSHFLICFHDTLSVFIIFIFFLWYIFLVQRHLSGQPPNFLDLTRKAKEEREEKDVARGNVLAA